MKWSAGGQNAGAPRLFGAERSAGAASSAASSATGAAEVIRDVLVQALEVGAITLRTRGHVRFVEDRLAVGSEHDVFADACGRGRVLAFLRRRSHLTRQTGG